MISPAKENPLVSVVVPCHNLEQKFEWFRQAVESVARQTYRPIEIVVVDDGSTDKTAQLIENFLTGLKNPRSVFKRQESHQGSAVARRTGVESARGEYVSFLDYDDLFLPNHIETLTGQAFRDPEVSVIFAQAYSYLDWNGRVKVCRLKDNAALNHLSWAELCVHLASKSIPVHMGSGVFCRRSVLMENLGSFFDVTLSRQTAEDVVFGFRLLLAGHRPFFMSFPTLVFRSYLDHHSRSRSAWNACDFFQVYSYIITSTLEPLLDRVKDQAGRQLVGSARRQIQHTQDINKVQSLFFHDRFLESIVYVSGKPKLYKYWLMHLVFKLSKRIFVFEFLVNLFLYLRHETDPRSVKELRPFMRAMVLS